MLRDFPSASYDAWKTRTPVDYLGDSGDVCGGCGYFIDECGCGEDQEDE